MGNFHCIPNGCGRVVYREYLPPQIRYRYGEDWQYVDGDDYAIEESLGGQRPGVRYTVKIYINKTNEAPKTYTVYVTGAVGNIIYIRDRPWESFWTYYYVRLETNSGTGLHPVDHISFRGGNSPITPPGDNIFRIVDIFPKDKPECTFTIYKNNQIVHQEVRDRCPEVEKLNCRLSDEIKVIKIDKLPWLERIEVVPYGYQNLGLNVYQAIIPDECLNIYKNLTTTIVPQFEGFPTPTNAAQATYGFIAQICSTPGCSPPEYQVICDCDCEKCPENTCPIKCDDVICCYDNEGKSVKSIQIENYCGDIS